MDIFSVQTGVGYKVIYKHGKDEWSLNLSVPLSEFQRTFMTNGSDYPLLSTVLINSQQYIIDM
jgi:hypothetical protein